MDAVRQTLAVIAVFALLGLAVWFLRRAGSGISFRRPLSFGGGARTRSLESMERLPLTPQHTLHVVKWHGRELMVATHPNGCTVLVEGARTEA